MKTVRAAACAAAVLLTAGCLSAPGREATILEDRVASLAPLVPRSHPRLLVLAGELEGFRAFVRDLAATGAQPRITRDLFVEPTGEPLPSEPRRIPPRTGAEATRAWREAYATAFHAGARAQRFAFAWLLSGEARYAHEAARRLLALASWDLKGGIDIANNDEAFIQHLRPMILAYDWACTGLTPGERATIEEALDKRLAVLSERVRRVYSITHPTPIEGAESHAMRFVSTLGLGGLALYHERASAPRALAWAWEYYARFFPVWGGDDGGYSEGLEYWTTGHNQHFMFLDAAAALGGRDLFARPYYRNNGYFALYNVMGYPYSSFGDLCNTLRPNANAAMHLLKSSVLFDDPRLARFAESLGAGLPAGESYYNYSFYDSLFYLYRSRTGGPAAAGASAGAAAADLARLPRSRLFADVGWVAMHSRLGDFASDIMLGFKSSPYGSSSHSFSDQNSFVLNALGEQLAISSGWREWYGSPHHLGWTRTTASKNAVLFGGFGQRVRDSSAAGRITRFHTGERFDAATGDASGAYAAEAEVRTALRHVLFVDRTYFVIADELASERPLAHQWLLHAKRPMVEDPLAGTVTIAGTAAAARLHFVAPAAAELRFSQTDRSAVPVDPAYRRQMPDEWHFSAETRQAQAARDFVAVLWPHRAGAAPIAVAAERPSRGHAFAVARGRREDLVLLGGERGRQAQAGGASLAGFAAVLSREAGRVAAWFVLEAVRMSAPGFAFSASAPVTAEAEVGADLAVIDVRAQAPVKVAFTLPWAPARIEGLSAGRASFDLASSTVRLTLESGAVVRLSRQPAASPIAAQ